MPLDKEDKAYLSGQLGTLEARLQGDLHAQEERLCTSMKDLEARLQDDLRAREERLSTSMKDLEARLTNRMTEEWRQLVGVLQEDFRDKFSLLSEQIAGLVSRAEFEAHVNDRMVHLSPPTSPPSPAGATRRRSVGRRR
jgi:uncharacterized membrane-anchored protein YjiN (DUF445 family)